jgi:hypothetical protein
LTSDSMHRKHCAASTLLDPLMSQFRRHRRVWIAQVHITAARVKTLHATHSSRFRAGQSLVEGRVAPPGKLSWMGVGALLSVVLVHTLAHLHLPNPAACACRNSVLPYNITRAGRLRTVPSFQCTRSPPVHKPQNSPKTPRSAHLLADRSGTCPNSICRAAPAL